MNRRVILSVLAVGLGLAAGPGTAPAVATRFEEVIPLADLGQAPVELKVARRTPLLSSRHPASIEAYLNPGQSVTVLGLGETMFDVETRIATGPARGWVAASALESLPARLRERLQRRRENILVHRELIARHEVAPGMLRREVESSLGQPARRLHRRTDQGDEEQWLYETYRYVPSYNFQRNEAGQLKGTTVSYRREAAVHRIVIFRGAEVAEITEERASSPEPVEPRPSQPVP